MRAWLRAYAAKHPCLGFPGVPGRRCATTSAARGRQEEDLPTVARGRAAGPDRSPRKRAGVSFIPLVVADAPNVVWAIDFQFDSTIDEKAIKIASMID